MPRIPLFTIYALKTPFLYSLKWEMKGILPINKCTPIFVSTLAWTHTHKTCSEHSWLNYWMCFGHSTLHKRSETPGKELEWSCPV